MRSPLALAPPFFEVGPKTYAWGPDLVALARAADRLSAEYDVRIILTPQYVDIPMVAQATQLVLVFAQHMDSLRPGRGIGAVLPEAIRDAGAQGVLLNHVERRLSHEELARTMERADEVGLATMVCADNAAEAAVIAHRHPHVIIVEDPGMIARGSRGSGTAEAIRTANEAIWAIDPAVRVLHGAGIAGPDDVYEVIAAGAQAAGSSSAVFEAADPAAMLEAMIQAVRRAWDNSQRGRSVA
jgi:triosephosphate isomerase (TIM)